MNKESQIAIANASKWLIFISAKTEYLKRGLEKADSDRYASEIKRLELAMEGFMEDLKSLDDWMEQQPVVNSIIAEISEFRMAPVVKLENGATPDEVSVALADLASHCIYFRTIMRSLAVICSYCHEASVRFFENLFGKAVAHVAEAAYTATLLNLKIQNAGKEAEHGK